MNSAEPQRFEHLFRQSPYLRLKNHLYNYRLRQRMLNRQLRTDTVHRLLEVGSGISPIVVGASSTVYSDLSFDAIRQLRSRSGQGMFVVADATHLPFRTAVFSHAVSSEVLEHIEQDAAAVDELSRVLTPGGRLLITFPHRQAYFSNDDRFVGHHRRYELRAMTRMLTRRGLSINGIRKVFGALDKLILSILVWLYRRMPQQPESTGSNLRFVVSWVDVMFYWANTVLMGLVMLEAIIIPRPMASVLLVDAFRKTSPVKHERIPGSVGANLQEGQARR